MNQSTYIIVFRKFRDPKIGKLKKKLSLIRYPTSLTSSTVCDLKGILANVFIFNFNKSWTLTYPSGRIFKFSSAAIWRNIRVLKKIEVKAKIAAKQNWDIQYQSSNITKWYEKVIIFYMRSPLSISHQCHNKINLGTFLEMESYIHILCLLKHLLIATLSKVQEIYKKT